MGKGEVRQLPNTTDSDLCLIGPIIVIALLLVRSVYRQDDKREKDINIIIIIIIIDTKKFKLASIHLSIFHWCAPITVPSCAFAFLCVPFVPLAVIGISHLSNCAMAIITN